MRGVPSVGFVRLVASYEAIRCWLGAVLPASASSSSLLPALTVAGAHRGSTSSALFLSSGLSHIAVKECRKIPVQKERSGGIDPRRSSEEATRNPREIREESARNPQRKRTESAKNRGERHSRNHEKARAVINGKVEQPR